MIEREKSESESMQRTGSSGVVYKSEPEVENDEQEERTQQGSTCMNWTDASHCGLSVAREPG